MSTDIAVLKRELRRAIKKAKRLPVADAVTFLFSLHGYSQKAICAKCGMSRQYLHRIITKPINTKKARECRKMITDILGFDLW